MYNEHSQERHLFAGVLKYDTGVVWLAPKAIRSHYHSKVVHIHFSDCNIDRLSKNLRKTWEMRQSSAINRKTSLCICCLLCVCWVLWIPAGSGWSSITPGGWAQAATAPRWWLPQDHHSYWHTACRNSWGWEAPPAHGTTASSERLRKNNGIDV